MVEKLKYNNLTWINIANPTQEDIDYLSSKYSFHALDLEDCMSKVQRPKFEEYDDYKFLVLHFPYLQQKNHKLSFNETDIFWGEDYIITLNTSKISEIYDMFNTLSRDKGKFKQFFSKSSDYLLYNILHDAVLKSFPLINQISREIDFLDNSFDSLKASRVIERISVLRRNIIFLQTSLKPQKGIFLILENQIKDQEEKKMDIYWGDLGDYIGKLLDLAEDYQELTEGLYSSMDSLLTYRTNNIIKTLTIFSVIMLPLNFITSFYGMNIRLPLQHHLGDSLIGVGIITGIMFIIAVTMIIYFKIKKF